MRVGLLGALCDGFDRLTRRDGSMGGGLVQLAMSATSRVALRIYDREYTPLVRNASTRIKL